MELIDKLVLPQSLEHLQLLHILTVVVHLVFIPFIGILLSGTIFSRYLKKVSEKEPATTDKQSQYASRLSIEILKLTTSTKNVGIAFGILPLLGLIMIFAQILHKLPVHSITYFIIAFILLIVGLINVYTYRYTFTLKNILGGIDSLKTELEPVKNEFESLKTDMPVMNFKSGRRGIWFVLLSTYFYFAGINAAAQYIPVANGGLANSFWYILISPSLYIYWLTFLAISFCLLTSYILFHYFMWEGGQNLEAGYKEYIKSKTIPILLFTSFLLPLLIIMNLITLDSQVLTFSVIAYSFTAMFLFFIVWIYAYNYLSTGKAEKDLNTHPQKPSGGWVFLLVLAAIFALLIKDQFVLSNTTKGHALVLDKDYKQEKEELLASVKSFSGLMSAEDIFTKKCSACHRFDQKVVGPPYNEVLKKYEGKKEDLAKFILNPVKVDPAYPVMPSQGLKPKEATAIAQYLLDNYQK